MYVENDQAPDFHFPGSLSALRAKRSWKMDTIWLRLFPIDIPLLRSLGIHAGLAGTLPSRGAAGFTLRQYPILQGLAPQHVGHRCAREGAHSVALRRTPDQELTQKRGCCSSVAFSLHMKANRRE